MALSIINSPIDKLLSVVGIGKQLPSIRMKFNENFAVCCKDKKDSERSYYSLVDKNICDYNTLVNMLLRRVNVYFVSVMNYVTPLIFFIVVCFYKTNSKYV